MNLYSLPETIQVIFAADRELSAAMHNVCAIVRASDAGWSSLAARRAHNPKVTGSNPVPATKY